MFCCTLLYVHSSFATILMGKRELVALLGLSSWCLVMVVWLFLVLPLVCLRFVIVVFPDHTHYFYDLQKSIWPQTASFGVKGNFLANLLLFSSTIIGPYIVIYYFCEYQKNSQSQFV